VGCMGCMCSAAPPRCKSKSELTIWLAGHCRRCHLMRLQLEVWFNRCGICKRDWAHKGK